MQNNNINNLENNSLSKEEAKRLQRQEVFIRKSREKFGDQFDYSKMIYINANSPIILVCKEHNHEFYVKPVDHLRLTYGGCEVCHSTKIVYKGRYSQSIQTEEKQEKDRINRQEKFIKNFIKKWGDENLDFSQIHYTNFNSPITIIHKEYGPKTMTASQFYREGYKRYLTKEELSKSRIRSENQLEKERQNRQGKFIEKFINKWGNENFDFSQVFYKSWNDPITIIHKVYGPKTKTASSFYRDGYKAPLTKEEKSLVHTKNNLEKESLREKRQEEFIQKSKNKFGDTFDYSKVFYKDSSTKVILIKKETGEEFSIFPYKHLSLEKGFSETKKGSKEKSLSRRAENFIFKFKEKFGDTYDLTKVNFINYNTPIIIGCPIHGWVKVYPGNVLNNSKKYACPICAIEHNQDDRVKRQGEKFFKDMEEKFGDNFDFSQSVYKGRNKDITFICKIHGKQTTTPDQLISSEFGCPVCGRESRKTSLEEFVKRAKEIHGDKYDYSEVEYINSGTSVKIFCKTHQEFFWQTPSTHILQKSGCPKCANCYSMTPEERKNLLEITYGDKFDFSLVDFNLVINEKVKFKIKCKSCGQVLEKSFSRIDFSKEMFCPYCETHQKRTTESFIEELKQIWGDKYIYDNVVYVDAFTPVEILCREHGSFWKTPNRILEQKDSPEICPRCLLSIGESIIEDFLTEKCFKHIPQKKYKDLFRTFSKALNKTFKHKNPLKFDFYLPDYNLCIEYQGEQHTKVVDYWGGNLTFLDMQERDQMKRDYCKYNKISLLEIYFNVPLDQIKSLLENLLKTYNFLEKPAHIILSSNEEKIEPY